MNFTNANPATGDGGARNELQSDKQLVNSQPNKFSQAYSLNAGRSSRIIVRVIPFGSLYRIEWPDIGLSDVANLTRCKAAALEWAERRAMTENRKNSAARRLKSLGFFWRSAPHIAQNLSGAA